MSFYIRKKDIINRLDKVGNGNVINNSKKIVNGTEIENYLATTIHGEQYIVSRDEIIEIDVLKMIDGYIEMAELNLKEAKAAEATLLDGEDFYK